MFTQLFSQITNLIVNPGKAWKKLSEEKEFNDENFYKSYFHPVIGIIALLSFLGILLFQKFNFQLALKTVIREIIIYFGGLFVAAYAVKLLSGKYFGLKFTTGIYERFVGYSSAAIYAITMVSALFTSLFFVQILVVYTAYIVWQGSIFYLNIKDDHSTKYAIFTSTIIIFSPLIIRGILYFVMPGMK
jgi:hypothetical protein